MRTVNGYRIGLHHIKGAAQFSERSLDDAAAQGMLDALTQDDLDRIWREGVKSPAAEDGINEREEQVSWQISAILVEKGMLPSPPEDTHTGPDIHF